MNRSDIDRLGLKVGQAVTLKTVADDGVDRQLRGMLVVAYNIPLGCIGGYYPECNVLLPIWHYASAARRRQPSRFLSPCTRRMTECSSRSWSMPKADPFPVEAANARSQRVLFLFEKGVPFLLLLPPHRITSQAPVDRILLYPRVHDAGGRKHERIGEFVT